MIKLILKTTEIYKISICMETEFFLYKWIMEEIWRCILKQVR